MPGGQLIIDRLEVPFGQVPHEMWDVPMHKDLSHAASSVLFQLLRYTFGFHRGDVVIGQDTLAQRSVACTKTTRRALQELEDKRVIKRTQRRDRRGFKATSRIRLIWPLEGES